MSVMLKKIILAALIVTSAAFAQVQIKVGGRAAFNYGTIWGNNTDIAKWGPGFSAGVSAKKDMTPLVTLVSGLEVDLRKISVDPVLYEEQSFSFWYIDLPLMARFNVTPQFFADAGLNFGFNFIASEKVKTALGTENNDIDAPTVALDLIAGAGFAVIPNLDVNLRILFGFTNMSEDEDFDSKNLRFQLGVTYWFHEFEF